MNILLCILFVVLVSKWHEGIARRFAASWEAHSPAHQSGFGQFAGEIEKLGKWLQVEVVEVCGGEI